VRSSHSCSAELHHFDHEARILAATLAGRLGLRVKISLNLLPASLVTLPGCLDHLLDHTTSVGLVPEQLVLEVTEGDVIQRPKDFGQLLGSYRAHVVRLAIDDFGAGYSGLAG
jgi:blue light- and temperature-responsive anti-repressor